MNADGSDAVNFTDNPAAIEVWASWAPDGSQIAFVSFRDGNPEIYVMDADGNNQVNITNHSGQNYDPDWSPDGSQLAFLSDRDGNFEIYAMQADGSNPVRLTNDPGADFDPDWSPDGSQIVFRSERDGNAEIYVMNADGSDPINLTNDPVNDIWPDWSAAIDPAIFTRVDFKVVVNGISLELLSGNLQDIGIDLNRKEWQAVEIPVELFKLTGPIESITFSGDLVGTFYLDDIRLVATTQSENTAVLEDHTDTLPQVFALSQNFPNPFNSGTVIRFALPTSGAVELALYNLAGQRVATLVDGIRGAGGLYPALGRPGRRWLCPG